MAYSINEHVGQQDAISNGLHMTGQTEGDAGYTEEENDLQDNYEDIGKDPLFDVPSTNVSVKLGETAVLPCFIEYLGKHKSFYNFLSNWMGFVVENYCVGDQYCWCEGYHC
ncbi:hypothetical protein HELRODRAFT_166771 [Helobdella robusta]|uniref:Uncharacterized protein n=1 Tax=Helobdella robusta TaxID=6412 RepID=T1EYI2_HELRO|nr:hypothetical protein HELRODRAFT_166771 [Helobdella robusta]ESO11745.1 hypothetical protein HELRODRAFT_166771 [Helobdella robusta]